MSLLSVCRAVCYETGFGEPATIIGNTDETALQLRTLADRSGKALARKPWEVLQKEHTFTTVASTETYAKPADYGFYQNDTAWDRTNYWATRGSLSPQEWQRAKSGLGSVIRPRFRIKGGLIYIDPIPSSANSMVIEYVSKNWVDNSGGPLSAFAADDDDVFFDEFIFQLDLTWRLLNRKGLAYAEEKAEAEAQIALAMAHDTPSPMLNQAGHEGDTLTVPTWSGTNLG